ncbi:hypothetical protein BDD12DRAFT_849652 [Trichophaea hybrida]|nr:hypothetical protein BDD12DRAFT_849652 [Trichophaea hybrida]
MYSFRTQTRPSSSNGHQLHSEIVNQQWTAVKDQVRQGINSIFEQNSQLESRLNDSMEENAALQKRIIELKRTLEVQTTIQPPNDYVLVLVDGDGMIFEKDLISDGKSGGATAARRLHDQVAEDTGLHPIIRVFANVAGLSSIFVRAQWAKDTTVFRAFTIGFSDPFLGHLDFVDIGNGRDKAAEKLKREFIWHRKNPNCRSILLGIGHDNGYARLLDSVAAQDSAVEVQLIDGSSLGWEINAMKFDKFQCQGVFSSEKPEVTPPQTTTNIADSAVNFLVNTTDNFTPAQTASIPDDEVFQSIRDLSPKACFSLYLSGECHRATCEKGHEYILNTKQMQALAITAKTMRCKFGRDCKNGDAKCFYSGH